MAAKKRRRAAGEFARIARIAALVSGAGGTRGIRVDIGDDAAVLRPQSDQLVVTVDVAVEGVHFSAELLSLVDVGYRSMNAAVSDLAAMGARPLAALSSLIVPVLLPESQLYQVVRGQAEAAKLLQCPIVGGNLSRGGELSITTTVLGEASRPLLRAGARAGDELWLLGEVGLSAAGLHILKKGPPRASDLATRRCVAAFRRPRARLAEGWELLGRARAAIDISDGLASDAGHLAKASRVQLILDERGLGATLAPELVRAAAALRLSALELALTGGEDYALLATGPRRSRPKDAVVIGEVVKGCGVVLRDTTGRLRPAGTGFDHFALDRPAHRVPGRAVNRDGRAKSGQRG